jgi:hypothetical protein
MFNLLNGMFWAVQGGSNLLTGIFLPIGLK